MEVFMQRILSNLRKAIEDYNMIEEGDKIAVGLSGGKDSITLLMALKNLQIFYPKKFDIIAISVHPGFDFFDTTYLEETCLKLDIPYFVEKSDIKAIVFDIRQEKNPCSLCANLRRGILNSVAIREGCNKIALGHNLEDVLETFFLNLLYTGNIHTFSPVSFMDRSRINRY
jgi:tRNA 2-thiocytidine biosynthesis protein TtcA